MRRSKKWVIAVIAGSMITLTACGSDNAGSSDPNAKGAGGTSGKEKPFELNVAFAVFNPIPSNLPEVQEAINKITLSKINATVKLTPINIGSWTQQSNLMLSSNEKLDLMYVSGRNYASMISKGQLVKLDPPLDQYGQDIKKVFDPSYLNASKVNGSIYGIPSNRDLAANYGVNFRKDLVDKYKIDVSTIKSIDDLESVFKTVKSGEPNMTPLVPQASGISFVDSYRWYDSLGDSIGVLPNYDNNLKVVDLYETPEYAAFLKKLRSWYQAGYILQDAATNKDSNTALIKANKGMAYLINQKPGLDLQDTRAAGTPIITVPLTPAYATTSSVSNIMWGIPQNATNPQKSMQFLNLMYADKDIVNLLDWGMEGKDYVKKSDGLIDYPPGVDSKSVAYNLNQGWMFGNQFLSYVFNGDDPQIWNKMNDFNKQAIKSKALGFSFDATPVKTEYAAVTNVVSQFKMALETGSVDPDSVLPQFISKLKASGMDKIIAEKQKRLDEWSKQSK
ncbi:ABC transporter substrate-binding protein [Paenibacillus sp. P26]|nr:ABC transporter substrate-binding protein [Paenibacillus sp. P26]UUZ95251.1 ABC transporter substrate-binding protein [Paenibacillus sp. P25]